MKNTTYKQILFLNGGGGGAGQGSVDLHLVIQIVASPPCECEHVIFTFEKVSGETPTRIWESSGQLWKSQ